MIEDAALTGLNHVLCQSAWARARLAPFVGRHARLSAPPVRLEWLVSPDGLCEKWAGDGNPDVEILLPAGGTLAAIFDRERGMQAARVEGNAEFATALAYVLKNLRWDFEEDLSRAVGDIAAHRIAGALTTAARWQIGAATNLAENVAEYLAEESRLVPSRNELAAFAAEVAAFDQALADLERRLGSGNAVNPAVR